MDQVTSILVFLFLTNMAMSMNLGIARSALTTIQDDLGLTTSQMTISESVYMFGHMISCIVIGLLYGRFRSMLIICTGLLLWIIASVGSVAANSYTGYLCARFAVSAVEGCILVTAPPLVDQIAPLAQKSLWMGIFWSSVGIGVAFGATIAGLFMDSNVSIAGLSGWRSAFLFSTLCMIPLFLFSIYANKFQVAAVNIPSTSQIADLSSTDVGLLESVPVPGFRHQARVLFGNSAFIMIVFATFISTAPVNGSWALIYAYLEEYFGFSRSFSSLSYSIVSVTTSTLGTLAGGYAIDYLRHRNVAKQTVDLSSIQQAARVLPPLSILSWIFLTLAFAFPWPSTFYIFYGIAMIWFTCRTAPTLSLVVWDTTPHSGGLGIGVIMTMKQISFALGPPIMGYVLEGLSDNWRLMFMLCFSVFLLDIILMFSAWRVFKNRTSFYNGLGQDHHSGTFALDESSSLYGGPLDSNVLNCSDVY